MYLNVCVCVCVCVCGRVCVGGGGVGMLSVWVYKSTLIVLGAVQLRGVEPEVSTVPLGVWGLGLRIPGLSLTNSRPPTLPNRPWS